MNEKPYEEMTDEQLEQLTEQTLAEHESGKARFQPRHRTTPTVEGTVAISLRVPAALLAGIKATASARGIPYQRLMKMWLEECLLHDSAGVARPVTLRLSEEQLTQLRQSGSLDIHLEAS